MNVCMYFVIYFGVQNECLYAPWYMLWCAECMFSCSIFVCCAVTNLTTQLSQLCKHTWIALTEIENEPLSLLTILNTKAQKLYLHINTWVYSSTRFPLLSLFSPYYCPLVSQHTTPRCISNQWSHSTPTIQATFVQHPFLTQISLPKGKPSLKDTPGITTHHPGILPPPAPPS